MTEVEDPVGFAVRHRMTTSLHIPFSLTWGTKGAYLAQWLAERHGSTTVTAAAKAAGTTPNAVRHWRMRSPEFRAAEAAVRQGQPYVAPSIEPAAAPEPEAEAEADRSGWYALRDDEPHDVEPPRRIPRTSRFSPPP